MKQFLLLLLLFLLLPQAAFCQLYESNFDSELFEKEFALAERRFEAGQFQHARNTLLRLIIEDSKEVRVYHLLGQTYHAMGELSYAKNSLTRASKLTRDPVRQRKIRQQLQVIERERRQEKLIYSSRNTASRENRVVALAKQGHLFELEKQYHNAFLTYQKIKDLQPTARTGYYLTGRLQLILGQRKNATANFSRLFYHNPEDTDSVALLINWGYAPEMITEMGFTGEFDFTKIEKFAAEILYRRGLKLSLHENKKAKFPLQEAVKLNPQHLRAHLALCEHLFHFGDLDGAFDTAGEVLRLDENNLRAQELRYYIFRKWGYQREATKLLTEGLKQDSNAVSLNLFMGLELAEGKRKQKKAAYPYLKKVIQLDPDNREAADALQRIGVRPNRILDMGYRGIFFPLDYNPLDNAFIPNEKKGGAQAKKVPPKVNQAKDFPAKGNAARVKRQKDEEYRLKMERIKASSEVELLGTGEIALGDTTEVIVPPPPPVTIEELLTIIESMPENDFRKKIRLDTVKRLFPKLEEEKRIAYRRKLQEELVRQGGTLPDVVETPKHAPTKETGEVTLQPKKPEVSEVKPITADTAEIILPLESASDVEQTIEVILETGEVTLPKVKETAVVVPSLPEVITKEKQSAVTPIQEKKTDTIKSLSEKAAQRLLELNK